MVRATETHPNDDPLPAKQTTIIKACNQFLAAAARVLLRIAAAQNMASLTPA